MANPKDVRFMTNACRRPSPRKPALRFVILCLFAMAGQFAPQTKAAEEKSADASNSETRLYDAVRFLASDELEGRGVGSGGLDQAAIYLGNQFAALGLKTELFDGRPFQKFSMTTGTELGEVNRAELVGPPAADKAEGAKVELQLGKDFNPLAIG